MLIEDKSGSSDQEIQRLIGERLRRRRLNLNMTQGRLAELSGVSRRTVTNLENGHGGSLLTLIAVLRALGLLGSLGQFIPEPGISPVQLAKLRGKERQRASRVREVPADYGADWEWD